MFHDCMEQVFVRQICNKPCDAVAIHINTREIAKLCLNMKNVNCYTCIQMMMSFHDLFMCSLFSIVFDVLL